MNERSYEEKSTDTEKTPPVDHVGPPAQSKGHFWKEILKFTVITILIVVPFRIYVAQPFIVSGASMDPTFTDNQYLIVDQISKRFEGLKRDSVVIFRYPNDTTKFFIKRIIGLPGETVEIKRGVVTIFNQDFPKGKSQGLTLAEPYVAAENRKSDDYSVTLKDGEYFVMGDNRAGSFDSRAWGPLPEKLIVGRPLVRLLPISAINFLPGDFSN